MTGSGRWRAALFALALLGVGTAVLIAGGAVRDAQDRDEARRASMEPSRAEAAAPGDTGVVRGGRPPRGQAPVVALTLPRFLNAFNAEASDRRVLLLLSPT